VNLATPTFGSWGATGVLPPIVWSLEVVDTGPAVETVTVLKAGVVTSS